MITKVASRVGGRTRKRERAFEERTWLQTSEKICQAQAFPPGFRIVLLSKAGAPLKRSPRVTSGDFGQFPISWPVKVFLLEGVATCVKQDLSGWKIELQTDEGEPVDEAVTLRRVREMQGNKPNPAFDSQDDLLCELDSELKDALGIFDPEVDSRIAPDPEVFLKALIAFIVERYDVDALEMALQLADLDIRKKREVEACRWDYLAN